MSDLASTKLKFSGLYLNFQLEGLEMFSGAEQNSSRIMVSKQNFEQNRKFL